MDPTLTPKLYTLNPTPSITSPRPQTCQNLEVQTSWEILQLKKKKGGGASHAGNTSQNLGVNLVAETPKFDLLAMSTLNPEPSVNPQTLNPTPQTLTA